MSPGWEPSLEDYIDIAAYLLGADRAAVAALPRLALAESALHAPFASFGGLEAYPTLVEQARGFQWDTQWDTWLCVFPCSSGETSVSGGRLRRVSHPRDHDSVKNVTPDRGSIGERGGTSD